MKEDYAGIEQAVREGYIEGIHRKQSKAQALTGFHESFEMIVLKDGNIEKVGIDAWLSRVETMKRDNPALWQAETSYNFALLDSTPYTASVSVDVYKGETHFSTDYMLLYNICGAWKIVSKIFSVPQ